MKRLFSRKNSIVLAITLLVLVVFIFFGNKVSAQANGLTWAHSLVGGIARAIVSVLGWILAKLMGILIYVAQYDNFINSTVIAKGWVVARDVANMFFIVILLIIAFATILRVEKYNYKKWLPKLILMAILINFSKTICGLLIDVSQVLMLTFVNAFSTIGAGSLTEMLGIADWQSLRGVEEINGWEVSAAYVLAVIYAFIALATVAAMVAMLVMRIIMIWVYVVLSPFAYLLASFPDGASYASKWWSEFSKNLIIGPVLAFFIWLSFVALGAPTNNGYQALGQFNNTTDDMTSTECIARDSQGKCMNYGTSNLMIQFIISIAMLLGGMKIAQEIGGAGGSVAGKTFSRVNKMGIGAAGAVGGAMGYNFAKRRYTNWRQDVKKSSQQRADLAYETVKGKTKGVLDGAVTGFGRAMSGQTTKERDEELKKRRPDWMENNAEVKRRENELYEAYDTGIYTDAKGKKFKWDETEEKYINEKDGEVAKFQYKEGDPEDPKNFKEIKRMSHLKRGFKEKMEDHTTKARALKNQMNDEKMSAKQKLFEAAGTSSVDLKRVMQDSTQSKDKRTAAAISLAIKDGFKNADLGKGRQEVSEAKALLGNNQPLLDKFDEKINKRFAPLNYDLETEEGKGKLKEGMANGSIDGYKQDSSTIDKELLKTLRDYSGKDYGKNITTMKALSKDHSEKIGEASRDAKLEALNDGEKIYDSSTNELNPFVKSLAKNGDIEGAFNNSNDSKTLNFDNESVDALKHFLSTASASDLDNFNNDYLDDDKLTNLLEKKGVSASSAEIQNMRVEIEKSIVQTLDVQKVASLEHLDKNPEFVRRYLALVEKHGDDELKELIDKNLVLRKIKPIK